MAKLSDQLDQMVSTSATKTSRIKGMSQESDNLKSKIDQLNNDKKSLSHQIETLKQVWILCFKIYLLYGAR